MLTDTMILKGGCMPLDIYSQKSGAGKGICVRIMHQVVDKLRKRPAAHKNGRKKLEMRILELHREQKVPLTDALRQKLLRANPSEKLLQLLSEGM